MGLGPPHQRIKMSQRSPFLEALERTGGAFENLRQRSRSWFAPLVVAGALAGYYFAPNLPLTFAFAIAFLIAAFKWLDWALVSVLFTSPLYRFPKNLNPNDLGLDLLIGRTASLEISIAEFAVLACSAVWVARKLMNSRHREGVGVLDRRLFPFLAPAFLLLLAAVISIPFSDYQKVSLREFRTVIIEPMLFYLLMLDTIRGKEQVSRMLGLFVLLGMIMSFASLYHYFFIGVTEATGGVKRILAIYHSPNALALFLGRIIPVSFALALARGLWRGSWRSAIPYFAALVVMALVLYLTFSRGAWLAVAITAMAMVLVFGKPKVVAGVLIVFMAVSGLLLFFLGDRVLSNAPILQRTYVWEAAINMLRDYPIMGVGLDNFLYHYPDYMLPEAWAEPNVSHPHNILLDFWLRLGILGVIVLIASQAVFWRVAVKLYRRYSTCRYRAGMGPERWLTLALMGSMASFLVHGLIDNSFFLIDLAYQFWFIMALLAILDLDSARNIHVDKIQKIDME